MTDNMLISKGQEFKFSKNYYFPKFITEQVHTWYIARNSDEGFEECWSTTFKIEEEAVDALDTTVWPSWFTEQNQFYVYHITNSKYSINGLPISGRDYSLDDFITAYTTSPLGYSKDEEANDFLSQFNLTLEDVYKMLT